MKIPGAAALVLASCSCAVAFQNSLWLTKRSGERATVAQNRDADPPSTTATSSVYMLGSNYLEGLSSNVQVQVSDALSRGLVDVQSATAAAADQLSQVQGRVGPPLGVERASSAYQQSPPSAASLAPPLESTNGGYLSGLGGGGGGAAAKPASYSGFGSKPQAPSNPSGYLGGLTSGATMASSSYAASQLSGSASMAATPPPLSPPPSFSPFGTKPKAVESGASYLGNLGNGIGVAQVQADSPPVAVRQAPPLSQLQPPPASYSPFGSKPKAVESGDSYLSNLGGGAASPGSYSPPPLQPPPQALSTPPVASVASRPSSFSPFGTKPKQIASTGYLGGLTGNGQPGGTTPVQLTSPQPQALSPATDASRPEKPGSFSPFGTKPKDVKSSGYLGGLEEPTKTESATIRSSTVPSLTTVPPPASSTPPKFGSFAPFGSKPKVVQDSGYLGALGGTTMSSAVVASAPATSNPAAATAATTGSSSPSGYSPYGAKPKVVAESGYLGNLGSSQAANSLQAPPSPATSAALTATPLKSNVKPASYSPFGSKPQAVAEIGYLGNLGSTLSAPVASVPVTSTPSKKLSPPANYSPFGIKPKPVESGGSYLSALGGPTPTQTSSVPTPVEAKAPATTKAASYSPFGSKPKVVEPVTSYLSNLGTPSPAQGYSSRPPGQQQQQVQPPSESYSPFGSKPKAIESGTSYLSNLGNAPPAQSYSPLPPIQEKQQVQPPPASYSPFGSKPKAVDSGTSYLSNLGNSPPAQSYSPPSPVQQQQVQPPPASYSPFGTRPKAVESGTSYVSNLEKATPARSYSPPPPVQQQVQPPPASYSPFGSKPKAVESGTSYLSNLGNAPPGQSYNPPPPVQQQQPSRVSYSPFGSKPKAVESGTSYLSNLGSGPPAQSYSPPPPVQQVQPPPASYSPFGSKPKVVESGASYLSYLAGANPAVRSPSMLQQQPSSLPPSKAATQTQPPPASYSPFGSKPRAVESGTSYLGNLGVGSSSVPPAPVVRQQIPTQQSFAAPPDVSHSPKPASFSPFGSKPKAVESDSSYLNNLASATPSSPDAREQEPDYYFLAGESQPAKPASFAPYGTKPKVVDSGSSYIGNLSGPRTVAKPVPEQEPQWYATAQSVSARASQPKTSYSSGGASGPPPTYAASPSHVTGTSGGSSAAPSSYSGFGKKSVTQPSQDTGYLGSLESMVASSMTSYRGRGASKADQLAPDEEARVLDLLAQADVRLSSLYVSDSTLDAEIKESAERIEDEIRVLEAKLRELDEKIAVMNGLDEKVEAILRNADVQGKVHGAGNSVVF